MEQRQRFSIRKFKTAVGSVLLASFLMGAPLLNAWTVLAQDQPQAVAIQQDLKNATNLPDLKATMTDLGLQFQEKAGTHTGELVHSVSSDKLAEVVKAAQAAGVEVDENGETTQYDSLEAAEADYEAQVVAVEEVTTKQIAATEAYDVAVEAYKVYQKAKAQYDDDKSKYDAYVAAKADYDTAFSAYQTAYQAYEKALADNVKAVADYEKAKLAYDKDYSLYQDKLAKYQAANKSNADKRATYEAALAQYQSDQATYQAALSRYQAAQAADTAAQTKYQQDLAKYQTEEAAYQQKLAEHQRNLAEAERSTGRDGYLSRVLAQNLTFNSEPNAKVSISGADYFAVDDTVGKDTRSAQTMFIEDYSGATSRTQPSSPINWTATDILPAYATVLGAGKTMEASYTNLSNSSYNGTPISKVTYTLTNKGSGQATIYVMVDPTNGLAAYSKSSTQAIGIEIRYYDSKGNVIKFDRDKPAILALSSLNHYQHPIQGWIHLEKVTDFNFNFVPITGSSVSSNRDGIYSRTNNFSTDFGSRFNAGEWDQAESPLFYYGGGAGVVESGDVISLTMVRENSNRSSGQWMTLSSKVAAKGISDEPVPPTKPTPPTPTTTGNAPEAPTPPKEPTYETVEEPTPPTEPTRPNLVEPTKPTQPTPPDEVTPPTEVDVVPEPVEPTPLSVTIHKATYATTPQPVKGVTNEAGQDVANSLVPKGSTVKFPLALPDLKANRKATETFIVEDVIDEGIELDLEGIKAAYPGFDVTYDEQRLLTLTAAQDYLTELNQDLTKDYSFNLPDLVGRVVNDGATYTNTIKVTINDYVAHTNTVKVTTPGKPNDPDHPTNNLIEPTKAVRNVAGEDINGQPVLRSDELIYPNTWDLDQYATIVTGDKDKAIFFFVEDIDGTKVTPNLDKLQLVDKAKEAVQGVSITHVESFDKADKAVQEALTAAGLADKVEGDFVLLMPDDMAAFEEAYVKTGNSISFDLVVTPKEDATGTIKNTSYQVDYSNGYVTKTVENPIQVTTEWEDKTTNKSLKDKVTGDKTEEKGEFTNYRYVDTVPTKTGIKHLFERLYTTEWEEEGTKKVLQDKVTDTKTHEKGEFDGMSFVKTVDTETGIKHIFKKTPEIKKSTTTPPKKQYTTEWVEEGTNKSLKDKVTGEKTLEAGQIDDYEYVKSEPTATGVKHIFKKVEKPVEKPTEKPVEKVSTPAKKTPLPSTGEQAATALGYLGAVLIGLAIAWKTGLVKRLKNQLKK